MTRYKTIDFILAFVVHGMLSAVVYEGCRRSLHGCAPGGYRILAITFNGKDVSDNYAITFVTGRLSVKPYDLTLYTKSYTKVYDGNPLGDIIDADETNYELKVDLDTPLVTSFTLVAVVSSIFNLCVPTKPSVE